MGIHLLIPSYNGWDLTHQLIFSLFKKEDENISSVVVMDNCSDDVEIEPGMAWWKEQKHERFGIIRQEENVGFLRNANSGLKRAWAPDDILILISNDVLVRGKFIDQIKSVLDESPKSLVGGILYSHDTGWNKMGDKIFPYLEGWLLATTAESWKELGYFDERFTPADFEDVDLSTTAISLGYQLVPLNNPSIEHLGGRTIGYSEARLARTNINKKKFEDKWIK
jgi:GT2 family glycosyltransferase